MSYQANNTAGAPIYPQQTGYPADPAAFNNAAAQYNPAAHPPPNQQYAVHPQQQGPMQNTFNNAGAQQTYSTLNRQPQQPAQYAPYPDKQGPPQNQQPAQYGGYPNQQGPPHMQPAVPGGQYPQNQQQQSQQKYAGAPQQAYPAQPQGGEFMTSLSCTMLSQSVAHIRVIITVVVVSGCPPGQHFYTTHFGTCGIIAAVLLFPIGLIFLLCVVSHLLSYSSSTDTMFQVWIKKDDAIGVEHLNDRPAL